jgi:1-pyrroline-5-carboxylate dehydrogenase
MASASFRTTHVPEPYNEEMRDYAPGTADAEKAMAACKAMREQCPDIPCVVGGEEMRSGDTATQTICSDHAQALCTYHQASEEILEKAVEAAAAGKKVWEALSFEDRAAVFLRAADLLSTKYRYEMLAACMLGQGKTIWQAEIDAIAETVDFWRFGVQYAQEIMKMQPPKNAHYNWNWMDHRPLEGFVVAITPFNFVAIGANLPSSPVMMGNVCLWKPASTAIRSNWLLFQILKEAGLPDGVINFLPGRGSVMGAKLFNHPDCAGVHFTGSTDTFNNISFQIASNVKDGLYKNYPRIVGETGGKDFHFVHKGYDQIDHFVNSTIRASFEYQGQKCSACSRAFIPDNLWPAIKDGLVEKVAQITMGQSDDWKSFMTAVIDKNAFNDIKGYIEWAKADKDCEIITGGNCDDSKGWFIEPTIILCKNADAKTMKEEIFGPVLSIHVYPGDEFEKYLEVCDQSTAYGLTGAIFAQDRTAVALATEKLRYAAGNFYINDKCTGSVVGQQPFGGSRLSGTNDKAGSALNLLRWVTPRSVKETMVYTNDWKYPHMQ